MSTDQIQGLLKHRLSSIRGWLVALLLLVMGMPMIAMAETVYVVTSRSGGAHDALAREFRSSLKLQAPGRFHFEQLAYDRFYQVLPRVKADDLILTVGSKAASSIITRHPSARVIATLIPRQAYQHIVERAGKDHNSTAIYLDQPIRRKLDMIRYAMPGKTRVGVLLGQTTASMEDDFRRSAADLGLVLHTSVLSENENLIGALDKVLDRSNVFLSIADPQVSNRNTAQHLLLATYRRGIPVIAYSRSYVRAGALMALYTTPQQFGRQASELVETIIHSNGKHLPFPVYPKYFSVEINGSVAHSLGLRVNSKNSIERQLRTDTSSG